MTDQMRTYRSAAAQNIGPGFKPGFFPDPLWEDQNFDLLAITVPGGNSAPTAYVIPTKGLVLPNFPNGAAITEVPASKEIDHSWEIGTSIFPHAHLRKLTDAAGSVFLGFEYEVLHGSTFIEGEKTAVVDVTDAAVLNEIVFADLGEIALAAITGDSTGTQITFRFYRDPANVADDFAGDIAVTTVGWHYKRNSAGSRLIRTK